ncbi:MAG: hypothetical protein WAM14_21875 [Candidatus Nitrosopolaris sp.]
MPKWKKDAKGFTVGVNYSDGRGYQSSIPKAVIDKLGKPNTLKFVINDDENSVQLISGKTHIPEKQ